MFDDFIMHLLKSLYDNDQKAVEHCIPKLFRQLEDLRDRFLDEGMAHEL